MKIALFANTDWFIYNFRRGLARRLVELGHDVLLISPPGPYGLKLREQGYRWCSAPMDRRSLNPFKEIRFILWLANVLRQERVEILHSFTIKSVVYGALACRLAGVPFRVNGIDGLGYVFISNDLKARLLRPLVGRMLRFACKGPRTKVVLLNRDDVEGFLKAGFAKASQISLIQGAGVDLNKFSPRENSSPSEVTRVLLAARLLWDKGVGEYAEAARIIASRGVRVKFLLAGNPDPGNPAAIDEKIVKGWVEEGLIDWLGHVEDMPKLLNKVDIVVLPSYREGLPTTLIEAAACGLPIVTTDVPGCRDVVESGVDGLLVPPKNSGALADAIQLLCNDFDFAKTIGGRAREKAFSSFDEKIIVNNTLRIYEEVRGE